MTISLLTETPKASVPRQATPTPPLFDVVETQSHYLVAVDLPNAQIKDMEIEAVDNELKVTGSEESTLFRYLGLGHKIRATYYNGALWLALPKGAKTLARAS